MLVLLVGLPTLVARADDLDVFSRRVGDAVAGRSRLVIYTSRETRERVAGPTMEMASHLHDVSFVTVVRVDLRSVPRWFRGMAQSRLRETHGRFLQQAAEGYRRRGVEPPADASDRFVVVGDVDGAGHQRMGLAQGFTEPLAVVEDPSGREVARGVLPRDISRLEETLRRVASP